MKTKPQGGDKQTKNKKGKVNPQNGVNANVGNKKQQQKNTEQNANNKKKKQKANAGLQQITSPNVKESPKKVNNVNEENPIHPIFLKKVRGDVGKVQTQTVNHGKGKKNKKNKLNASKVEVEDETKPSEDESTPIENTNNVKKSMKKKNRRKKSKQQINTSNAIVTVEEEKDSDAEVEMPEEDASESEVDEDETEAKLLNKSLAESEVSQGEVDLGEDEETTIFVGNLPNTVTKKEILNFFKSYGQIKNIRLRSAAASDQRIPKKVAVITKDFHASANSINAFVTFNERFQARNALAANGSLFNGHHIRVNFSKASKEHNMKVAIFVGNLPFSVRDDELWEVFENCGEIESVRVIRDKITRMGKGFGYVNFKSPDAVELALQMEDVTLQNRKLRIARASNPKAGQDANKKGRKRSLNASESSENSSPQKKKKGNQLNESQLGEEEVQEQNNVESKKKVFQGQKSMEKRQKKQTFKKKMKKVRNEKQKKSIANFLNSKPGKEIVKNKS